MSQKPHVRLHLFFATENDRAVILRQGPARLFRLILWHRDTDRFEDGQWLKHKVYVDACDLSPDGRHFIYFTLDGKWDSAAEGAYTVISRPPWFTGLALFPEGNTWGGGGRFLDNRYYVASGGEDLIGRAEGLIRLLASSAPGQTTFRRAKGKPVTLSARKAARADIYAPAPSRTSDLDRYDTQGGRLYRRAGGEMTLIRDFTEMEFEPLRAPYDWREERDPDAPPAPWHPLDGDDRR